MEPVHEDKKPKELTQFDQFNKKLDEYDNWLSRCDQLLDIPVNKTNEFEIQRLIADLNECENDLSYQKSMFESDFNRYRPKLKNSTECDSVDQYYTSIMNQYSKVSNFFVFIFMTNQQ